MSSSVDEHRNWLAMQYVLGELSESDRDAFEERMADDLTICEAVTTATRLMLATRAALQPVMGSVASSIDIHREQRATPASRTNAARGSWLVVAIASAAMAMLCLFAVRVPVGGPDLANYRDPAAAELVSLWHSGMNSGEADSDDMDDVADASGDVTVPDWMLAAVSFEAGTIDGPSDKVQEN